MASAKDKLGTDKAYECADYGALVQCRDITEIAGVMHARHGVYQSFLHDFIEHIIEASFIHRDFIVDIMENAERDEGYKRLSYYRPLQYPTASDAGSFAHLLTACEYAKLCRSKGDVIH